MERRSLTATRAAAGTALLVALVLVADAGAAADPGMAPAPNAAPDPNVVEVTSTGMNFSAPAAIPSGWTTFRFRNRTDVTHFFVLERLPAGKTVADSRAEVVPVFQAAMDRIMAGDPEAGFAEFERLPAWFADVAFVGGAGLTGPNRTSTATVRLEPGTYVIECYVKTPDGTFHSSVGMTAGLTVSDERTAAGEPEADVRVMLGDDGMELLDAPGAGEHTFGVRFESQRVHENAVGHDVHLVRLSEGTAPEDVAAWMSWADPAGLATPAPAAFLGGVQEQPDGTAYFTATLEPGRYALVAEVPDPIGKNMLVTFDVNP
ncbi:MAG: hypothetical protein ACN0LA_12390 [Candidatus Longimicrobiales bacterium M2_2A_002]